MVIAVCPSLKRSKTKFVLRGGIGELKLPNMQRVLLIFSIICGAIGLGIDIVVPKSPPEPWKAALMSRYVIHESDWVSLATISTQNSIKGYPFVGLKSLSDGQKTNSTGIPYLYMTPMDVSGQDVESDNRVSIMATLAQSDYCTNENFDPQDPRCAKVLITGRLIKVKKSSPEYTFGKNALFERHPSMRNWPTDHKFYLAKVDIQQIEVLDFFGGVKHVSIKDYFDVNITNIINHDRIFNHLSVIEITIPNN